MKPFHDNGGSNLRAVLQLAGCHLMKMSNKKAIFKVRSIRRHMVRKRCVTGMRGQEESATTREAARTKSIKGEEEQGRALSGNSQCKGVHRRTGVWRKRIHKREKKNKGKHEPGLECLSSREGKREK